MQTKKILRYVAVVFFAFVIVVGCAGTKSKSPSEKDAERDSVRTMAEQSLSHLYQNEPAAKGAVADAAGYAVFSDFGFKVMFLGGAKGKGVAVNNATKQETFMKMLELQPGLGLGAQKFRIVFIFEHRMRSIPSCRPAGNSGPMPTTSSGPGSILAAPARKRWAAWISTARSPSHRPSMMTDQPAAPGRGCCSWACSPHADVPYMRHLCAPPSRHEYESTGHT